MQYFNKPVAVICVALASAFVQAQQATYDFDIPAQPAGQVLGALVKQTGLQPFYAEGAVKGVQSPGVKGRMSLREALDKALAGTGLTYQFTGEKAVAIKVAPAERVPVIPHATRVTDPVELGEITVTAQQRKQREIDVPIAINTLNSEEIANRGITDLQSLSFAVPGMTAVVTGMAQNRIMLRGIGEGAGAGNFRWLASDRMKWLLTDRSGAGLMFVRWMSSESKC